MLLPTAVAGGAEATPPIIYRLGCASTSFSLFPCSARQQPRLSSQSHVTRHLLERYLLRVLRLTRCHKPEAHNTASRSHSTRRLYPKHATSAPHVTLCSAAMAALTVFNGLRLPCTLTEMRPDSSCRVGCRGNYFSDAVFDSSRAQHGLDLRCSA
jgi:hypothetical protein